MSPKRPYATKLRHAIDSGRTGGKVSHPDLAAAPLGTDEEAAGAPVPHAAVEQALRDEVRRPPQPGKEERAEPTFGKMAGLIIAAGVLLAGVIWWAS